MLRLHVQVLGGWFRSTQTDPGADVPGGELGSRISWISWIFLCKHGAKHLQMIGLSIL